MKTQVLDSFDSISLISLFLAFKLAYKKWRVILGYHVVATRISEGKRCLQLKASIILKFKSHMHQNEGPVISYSEAAIYLLDTYRRDDVVALVDADLMRLTKRFNKMSVDFAAAYEVNQ